MHVLAKIGKIKAEETLYTSPNGRVVYLYQMKNYILALLALSFTHSPLLAQDKWSGAWEGTIDGANLRIVFHVRSAGANDVKVTMDSPDQSAFGLPVEKSYVKGDSIFIAEPKFRMSFAGNRTNDTTIVGVFTQGIDIPLTLKKNTLGITSKKIEKKQTPQPPFPYNSEDVSFTNTKAAVTLSGTITYPPSSNGKAYPAIVLVSGSGPQDRDETIFGHKPFAVIADHLTRQGMVVLRYDDRGHGKSTGDFSTSTSHDFASDASAAINYLKERKEVDKKRIGILGHSEGGMVAPMVAIDNKDVNFIILMAGPGIPIIQLMTEQNIAIMKSQGLGEQPANAYGVLYKTSTSIAASKKMEEEKIKLIEQEAIRWSKLQEPGTLKALGFVTDDWKKSFATSLIKETATPWMQYFLNYEPADNLKKLKIRVLALNGSEDDQVVPASNLAGIEAALKLSKSPGFKTKNLEGLNHLFQKCKNCTVAEYGSLEETISPVALDEVSSWLKNEKILVD